MTQQAAAEPTSTEQMPRPSSAASNTSSNDEWRRPYPFQAEVVRLTDKYAIVQASQFLDEFYRIALDSSKNIAEKPKPLYLLAPVEIWSCRPSLRTEIYKVRTYKCSSDPPESKGKRIVVLAHELTPSSVGVVGTGFRVPFPVPFCPAIGETQLAPGTFLIGEIRQMAPFFRPSIKEGRLYYAKDEQMFNRYRRELSDWQCQLREKRPKEPEQLLWLDNVRELSDLELNTVMTKTRNLGADELAQQMAELFIRDPMVAKCRFQEVVARIQARKYSVKTNVEEYCDPSDGGKFKMRCHLSPEQSEFVMGENGPLRWRVGNELQLEIPDLMRISKGNSASVEISKMKTLPNGSTSVEMVPLPISWPLFHVLKSSRTGIDGTVCRIGAISETLAISIADVIEEDFLVFFNNTMVLKNSTGRAAPNVVKLGEGAEEEFYVTDDLKLDPSQLIAMRTAIASEGFTCIQAPPGSGKTFLISALVKASADSDPFVRFAIAASTNVAVTNAIDGIRKFYPGEKVCREFSKRSTLVTHEDSLEVSLSEMALRAEEFVDVSFNPDLRKAISIHKKAKEDLMSPISSLQDGLRRMDKLKRTEGKLKNEFLAAYAPRAFGSTARLLCRRRAPHITHLVIDEAVQMSEEEAMALCCRMPNLTHITLLGDSKQLGPFSELDPESEVGRFAREGELQRLQRLASTTNVHLCTVYRCHPLIVENWLVPLYGPYLKAGVKAEDRALAQEFELNMARDGKSPFLMVHFENSYGAEGDNQMELKVTEDLIHDLIKVKGIPGEDIVVLCHHKAQREALILTLKGQGSFGYQRLPVHIYTVDSFQGKEARVVIVLMTKTLKTDTIDFNTTRVQNTFSFVSQPERETVAVSRARDVMFLLGDWKNILRTEFWGQFRQNIYDTHCMVDTDYNPINKSWIVSDSRNDLLEAPHYR